MLQLLAQLSTQWTFKCHCNFVCLLICFFANEELTFKMSVTSLSKRVFLTLIILSLDLPSLTLSYCFTNIHDDPQRVLSKRI